MKKLDKLIVGAFLGPFFLTFIIVVFIFLTQYLLKYLEDFVGKGLGISVFSELIFYFSLNMVPVSLPLAVLLSSLMTFGNLGEHFELTAIKSSGISLLRTFVPISFIVVFLCVVAFYFNNSVVPKANLKAFSLLYDIRQKKPTLDFKEGSFYNGLPGYSIKIGKKFEDGKTIKNVMIYNHSSGRGNTDLILADSGKMYMMYDDKYLFLELFQGKSYTEYMEPGSGYSPHRFVRNDFKKSQMVFSLASFDMNRTKEELFSTNKVMLNINELQFTTDSLRDQHRAIIENIPKNVKPFYAYFTVEEGAPLSKADSLKHISMLKAQKFSDSMKLVMQKRLYGGDDSINKKTLDPIAAKRDSINLALAKTSASDETVILNRAVNQARSVKSFTSSHSERLDYIRRDANSYEIEKYRKYTQSVACIIMFLIGAPLGAIIKKGGLGVPVLISIVFFIIFYILSILGEKWSKEGLVDIPMGMWAANIILLPFGIFALSRAKNDSRLFDFEIYQIWLSNLLAKFKKKRPL